MVARKDLRPTRPDDSLKRLVNQVNNPQTVPHGVKIAQPGEYVEFFDSSYQAHRWDGDVIADFDSRMSDARAAVDKANASLAVTEQNLAGASERIKAVEGVTTPEAIGDTAAAQINGRQLIVGRDAVVPGTLDVAQLNVTEQMSAQMVSAMSVESKKLVVTEDAIMNRVTVIQDIVTPQLVAERVNAALITGSVLQTSSLDNTGVKISNTGYKAYNANGDLAVNLDGKNNLMVGTFSTSTKESSGVKISQSSTIAAIDLYTPDWGGNVTNQYSHAGIWYQIPSNLAQRGLNIVATDSQYVTNTDPGLLLRPGLRGYGFQGMWASDLPGSKAGKTTYSAGVPAGGYVDFTFSFSTPLSLPVGGQVMVIPTVVTANKNEHSAAVFDDNEYGFKLRVVNLVGNRATGTVWIKWVAFIV